MENQPVEAGPDGSSVDLINRVKTGTLVPDLLTKEQRQLCVEALYFDSISPGKIAEFLKVTDRTIRRDLEDIRMRNALTPDLDLARQIVGEFLQMSRISRGNLMKLARNSSASTAERTQAEYYAHMVNSDMITKLQSLGYLPKSADALLVMQKKEEFESNEALAALAVDLDDMARLSDSPEQAQKLMEIKDEVTKEKPNADEHQ